MISYDDWAETNLSRVSRADLFLDGKVDLMILWNITISKKLMIKQFHTRRMRVQHHPIYCDMFHLKACKNFHRCKNELFQLQNGVVQVRFHRETIFPVFMRLQAHRYNPWRIVWLRNHLRRLFVRRRRRLFQTLMIWRHRQHRSPKWHRQHQRLSEMIVIVLV